MNLEVLLFFVVGLFCKVHVSDLSSCSCTYYDHQETLKVECLFPDPVEIKACFLANRAARTLLFQNSSLTSVPYGINVLEKLTHLDLSHNKITRIDFRNLTVVCRNIQQLNLDFNQIIRLKKGDLDCLSSLVSVHLANNSLSYIQAGSFNENHELLKYIHLINNQLKSLDPSLFLSPPLMKYGGRVNASWNNISKFTNDLHFTIMDINISMSFLVGLTHNNITGVDVDYYTNLLNVTDVTQLYRLWNCGFDVRFNPFVCDCAMYTLSEFIRIFRHMDPDNPVFSIACDMPMSLKGRQIYEVPKTEFNCSVIDRCPENCKCTKTVAIGLVSTNCGDQYTMAKLPDDLPLSREIHLSVHSPWMSILSSKHYLGNVTQLDVSESQIIKVDSNIVNDLANITKVFLDNNALQILPVSIQGLSFDKLSVLTLHGNPFRCDCNSLWLKKWLLDHEKRIPMQDKILCGSGKGKGRILVNVPDSDFVCDEEQPWNKVVMFVPAVVVVSVVVVICFVRRKVNLLMIEYINSSWCRKRLQSDHDFDLFISHSSLDDSFIHGFLVPKLLQHSPPYKLFLDERDFLPGQSIAYNINRAIENSHITLLIVSDNFLQSKWCMMEFRQAHLRLLKDRNINIVIIVLGDPNKDLIDDELKLYMQTHVYLCDSDKYFWPKLLQAMPILINKSDEGKRVTVERSISANENESSEQSPLLQ